MDIPVITDFAKLGITLKQQNKILLLVASATHCAYCKSLKKDFLHPIFLNAEFRQMAIWGELSMDDGLKDITDFNGSIIETVIYSAKYKIRGTPTMLFLDYKGNVLHKPIFGIATPDFFFTTIEDAIKASYEQIN